MFQLVLAAFPEMVMHVYVLPVGVASFPEAVHVELPDEGRKVAVLEVLRKDLVGEFGDVFDVKTIAGGGPAYDRLNVRILDRGERTSIISRSLLMKSGTWLLLPFLLLLMPV